MVYGLGTENCIVARRMLLSNAYMVNLVINTSSFAQIPCSESLAVIKYLNMERILIIAPTSHPPNLNFS